MLGPAFLSQPADFRVRRAFFAKAGFPGENAQTPCRNGRVIWEIQVKPVIRRGRVHHGRLTCAPAVCHPVAIPANLVDLLDQIGIDILVRFQHFEETTVLDAFFHLVEGTFDRYVP
jgi:hypothetical protein